jgi:hypothetical protein
MRTRAELFAGVGRHLHLLGLCTRDVRVQRAKHHISHKDLLLIIGIFIISSPKAFSGVPHQPQNLTPPCSCGSFRKLRQFFVN